VSSVESNSPAARAGLRDGDLIVRFGDSKITGVDELHRVLRTFTAGTAAKLEILRRGVPLTLDITPVWAA
jgi:serine protease Do